MSSSLEKIRKMHASYEASERFSNSVTAFSSRQQNRCNSAKSFNYVGPQFSQAGNGPVLAEIECYSSRIDWLLNQSGTTVYW